MTRSLRNQAWLHHQSGDLTKAEQCYRQLLARGESVDVADVVNLGAILRQQGRLGDAEQHYEYWFQRIPADESVCLNFVNCLIERDHPSRAIEVCEVGLRQDPDGAPPRCSGCQMAAGQPTMPSSYERIL